MPHLRNLTLKHLRALEATVRNGSVTAAAHELFVTPPAVTTQLKTLEDLIGAPLFDRSVEGFVPTEIGGALLETARDVEMLFDRTHTRIAALRSGAAGSVIFGAVSTAKYIAPSMVARFQKEHPNISVKLVIGNRGEIIRGLESNELDIVIMGRPPEHPPMKSDFLCEHPHVMIVPATHRLANRKRVKALELRQERFLSREQGSGTRILMDRFLSQIAARQALDVVEMGTNETIKQAVIAGLGIAIISAHACLIELEVGKLVSLPVAGFPVMRKWYLTHRADRVTSHAAKTFRRFIMDSRSKLVPALEKE